jgi:hypothetical protein
MRLWLPVAAMAQLTLMCFGRHTAHHQEFKNYNCSLWFYLRLWLSFAAAMAQPYDDDNNDDIAERH